MGRTIQLRPDTVIVSDAEAIVEIAQTEVHQVALEIALLGRKLNDVLFVLTQNGPKIALRLLDTPKIAARARVLRTAQQQIRFDVPINLLGYLEAVLLRTYRDGIAEVNHIHIEGDLDGDAFDLTVMFELSRPPMTPEQIERLTKI